MISWILNTLFQFSSVAQLGLTLCSPMDCIMPGFLVLYHLPEFAQTHVHQVGDAIQPSHHLLSPSPPAFSLSQHQGLSQWVSSSHQVAKYWSVSPSNEYSGLVSFGIDWLDLLAVQVILNSLSNTIVQKHQFFGTQPSSQSNSHIHTWPQEKP